jgi:hypothetical protein
MSNKAVFDERFNPDPFSAKLVPPAQKSGLTTITATHTVTITPEMADYLLANCFLPGQRGFVGRKLEEYQMSMKLGYFQPDSHMEMAYNKSDGKFYLLNGYHRVKAILTTGIPLEVTMTMHRLSNMDEIMRRYSIIDKVQVRSLTQTIHAENLTRTFATNSTTDVSSFATQHLRVITAGTRMIVSGFRLDSRESRNLDHETIMKDAVGDWLDEAKTFFDIIHKGEAEVVNRMRTAAVLSVGMVLLRYQPEKAYNFLTELAHNRSGLGSDEAAYKLRRYLAKHRVHDDGQNLYARKMGNAWNAFFKETSLASISANGSWNIELSGTPYTRYAPLYYIPEQVNLVSLAQHDILDQELVVNKSHPNGMLITKKGVITDPEMIATFIEYRFKAKDAKRRGIGQPSGAEGDRFTALQEALDGGETPPTLFSAVGGVEPERLTSLGESDIEEVPSDVAQAPSGDRDRELVGV